jgi:hypothetical protein
MAVGSTPNFGGKSYVSIGRETTLGTYTTCTAGLEPTSFGVITQKDSKILEQISRSRTYAKRISLGKTVSGPVEFYMAPQIAAHAYLHQNAFGGTVTSATATGETAGGAAFSHTFETGCMDQSYTSLCINARKGDSTNGQVFEYSGVRVNSLSMVGALDEPLMVTAELIGIDSSTTSNDVESALTYTAAECLTFVGGRFSVESTFAGLTTTSFWEVQDINFTMNNNLKTDAQARRIGSDVLSTLPIGVQTYELSATIRFDTTTAYDAMIAATEFAAEFEFTGDTLSTSIIKEGIKVQFQKVGIKDAGEPTVDTPDGVLTSTVTFDVLRDESASGYAVQAVLTNDTSSYA